LDRGAVREVVDDGLTGIVFSDIDQMAAGLDRVLGLDRQLVRRQGVKRFGVDRMVDEYVAVYRRLAGVRPLSAAQS
jgi:glycosyltransferase involved in cell wall biosynthesis